MAREGTRSATGNSKPRVFDTVDTAPAIKRTTKPKTATTPKEPVAPKVKGAKPAGVTKKTPAKKDGVGAKVRCHSLRLRPCRRIILAIPCRSLALPRGQ